MVVKQTLVMIMCALFLGGCVSGSGGYSGSSGYDEAVVGDQDGVVTSDNWECTSDCSGHEAGYAWAEDNDVTNPDDCGGKSESFIEGCEAWANEQIQGY